MNKRMLHTGWKIGFALFTTLAAGLQAIAAWIAMDVSSNYFYDGSPLPTLAMIFALLGAGCGTLAAYTTDKNTLAKSPFSEKPLASVLSSAVSAIGFLTVTVFFLAQGLSKSSRFTWLIVATAAIAVLYTIALGGSSWRKAHPACAAILGFAAVLFCVACNAYYYFDVTVEMNAPFKVTLQTGLLMAMVYFTGELRYLLGRALPRFFLALAAWTLSFGALGTPALLVAYLANNTDRMDYVVGAFLLLCLSITVIFRIHTLLNPKPTETDTEPAASESESIGKDTV